MTRATKKPSALRKTSGATQHIKKQDLTLKMRCHAGVRALSSARKGLKPWP